MGNGSGVSRTGPARWSESGSCWPTGSPPQPSSQTPMTSVLDQLGLTELATSIPGVSAVGAAAILAETGDPHRFATGRKTGNHRRRTREDGHWVGSPIMSDTAAVDARGGYVRVAIG
jgi:transposase